MIISSIIKNEEFNNLQPGQEIKDKRGNKWVVLPRPEIIKEGYQLIKNSTGEEKTVQIKSGIMTTDSGEIMWEFNKIMRQVTLRLKRTPK